MKEELLNAIVFLGFVFFFSVSKSTDLKKKKYIFFVGISTERWHIAFFQRNVLVCMPLE